MPRYLSSIWGSTSHARLVKSPSVLFPASFPTRLHSRFAAPVFQFQGSIFLAMHFTISSDFDASTDRNFGVWSTKLHKTFTPRQKEFRNTTTTTVGAGQILSLPLKIRGAPIIPPAMRGGHIHREKL